MTDVLNTFIFMTWSFFIVQAASGRPERELRETSRCVLAAGRPAAMHNEELA